MSRSLRILHLGEMKGGGAAPSVHSDQVCQALRQLGHTVTQQDGGLRYRFAPARLAESLLKSLRIGSLILRGKFDLIYCRETWLDPFTGLILRLLRVPSVTEVNGLVLNDLRLDGARGWLMWLSQYCQGWNLKSSTGVVAACAAWADFLRDTYGLNRVEVIQNGVELEKFGGGSGLPWRAQLGLDSSDLVLGYVGNLGRYYDFEPFLKSLKGLVQDYPALRMVIVGSGPGAQSIRALAEQLKVMDWVRFHGPVAHGEVPELLRAFDLGLLPVSAPRLRETRGVLHAMKLAEYCAAGLPILRSDYPGSDSDRLLNDFSWAVSPPSDSAEEVLRCALQVREDWPKLGRKARAFAEERLSWRESMVRLESLILRWTSS